MKTANTASLFSLLALSGCALTSIPQETEIETYAYALKCIDAQKGEEYYFSTQSYVPMTYPKIYEQSKLEGEKSGLNLALFSCHQIEVKEIPDGLEK